MIPRRLARQTCLLVGVLMCVLTAAAANGASEEQAVSAFAREVFKVGRILNIAHAGASSLAPQNTMAAGRKAFDAGADVWGVDVQLTADGVFVLMHDDTLDRTTNVEDLFPIREPWRVNEFTFEEVRSLDAGSWFVHEDPFEQIEEGNVSAAELAAYVGEPVPPLREALAFVSDCQWLIDIEVKPMEASVREAAARRLVDLIRETGTESRVLVSSFDHAFLIEVMTIDPFLATGALTIFAPLNTVDTLSAMGVDVYLPSPVGFTADLLEQLAERRIHVFVWTYNTQSQLEFIMGHSGITGIYTDFPQRLGPLLAETEETEAP
ncbi:MAG: glycerophosphodiester phosphodiesterase family protein [Candidatus Bipolaricaulota bacterium]